MCFRPLARWIGLYLDEVKNYDSFAIDRFRPLARWIGLYHFLVWRTNLLFVSFRPLARWIGLYPHILCTRQLLATQDVGPTGNTIYIVPYDCRPIKA